MDQQIIKGIEDSLTNRGNELLRSQAEFQRLLSNLPSDYVSTQSGPNYGLVLQMIAEEYARQRTLQTRDYDDARWDRADVDFLFQNLGHRLHDLEERTSFFPEITYDEQYRDFLLGLHAAVLNGARTSSLEAAAEAATGLTGEIIEFFKLIPPRMDPSSFDVSDRNYWKFQATPTDTASLALVYLGLLFVGRLIKPAHTLFDVSLQLPNIRRVGLRDGCCAILGVNGKLQASTILKSRLKSESEVFEDCVINRRKVRAKVTAVYNAGTGIVEIGGVPVLVTADTVFSDIDGIYTDVSELLIGDVVEVSGFLIDVPISLEGFIMQEKISDHAVCVSPKWRLEQYKYRSYRVCQTDNIECRAVDNETVIWADFPTRREFIIHAGGPLARLDDGATCDICYQTALNGIQLVTVMHDDGGGAVELDVDFVDPYTGRVVLDADAPAGDTVVSYRYWHGTPILGLHYDTDGLTYDQDLPCSAFMTISDHPGTDQEVDYIFSLGDGPNYEEILYLNDPADFLNDEDVVLAPGNVSGVQTLPAEIFCQQPWQPAEPTYIVHYSGFQHAHSSCYDTPNMHFDDGVDHTYRHKLDDFNVIDSRGHDLALQEAELPEEVFEALINDQVQRIGTILVPWTQDFRNGVNRVFQSEVFAPSFSDVLNSASAYLNQQNVELNDGVRVAVYEYLQELYTCLIAFTRFTDIDTEDRCRLVPKARACRSMTYYSIN